jgi:NAD(P)-binding Rossmann-like domain
MKMVMMMLMPMLMAVATAFQPFMPRTDHHWAETDLRQRTTVTSLGATTEKSAAAVDTDEEVVDVVVIGAGIGGLSCAALSSLYGFDTLCLEAHDTAGGVAHSFVRKNKAGGSFEFDSGPSLMSGLSRANGTNPLRQVLDALDVADEISWKTYDGWLIHDYADDKSFKLTTGSGGEWEQALEEKAGATARLEFEALKREMLAPGGLSES